MQTFMVETVHAPDLLRRVWVGEASRGATLRPGGMRGLHVGESHPQSVRVVACHGSLSTGLDIGRVQPSLHDFCEQVERG